MNSVTFHVPGKPQGKARARTVHNKNIGHSVSYTPEKDLLYENLIKAMYINAAKGTKFDKEIPVALRIVARFEPPKSTSKKKVQQMLAGELHVMKKLKQQNKQEGGGSVAKTKKEWVRLLST